MIQLSSLGFFQYMGPKFLESLPKSWVKLFGQWADLPYDHSMFSIGFPRMPYNELQRSEERKEGKSEKVHRNGRLLLLVFLIMLRVALRYRSHLWYSMKQSWCSWKMDLLTSPLGTWNFLFLGHNPSLTDLVHWFCHHWLVEVSL